VKRGEGDVNLLMMLMRREKSSILKTEYFDFITTHLILFYSHHTTYNTIQHIATQHNTTHNTQHTTHNTQHTTHNITQSTIRQLRSILVQLVVRHFLLFILSLILCSLFLLHSHLPSFQSQPSHNATIRILLHDLQFDLHDLLQLKGLLILLSENGAEKRSE
jgi:hypothetical protein